MTENYDVCRFLVDQGSSCDIMHDDLLEKLHVSHKKITIYKGRDLQSFSGSKIDHEGYIEMMVSMGEKEV